MILRLEDEENKKRFKEVFNMTEIGKMILEDGMAKGMEKGRAAEGKVELLLKQLTKKFKKIPEEYRKKIKELSDETLEIIGLEIFDMKDIKELEKYF